MNLYKRGGVWYYDFWLNGKRHNRSTRQRIKSDGQIVAEQEKRQARRRAAGLEAPTRGPAPRFQEWAEVHFAERAQHMTRPEFLEDNLRVILRYWGRRPERNATADDPYHDLCLDDPIRDPIWIERFEAWMRNRGASPQTRNHYRSVMRGMYHTALLPKYRTASGMTMNPFRDLPRETVTERTVTVSVPDLRKWLANASYHVRVAVAVAALAPKLRLAGVLSLTWADSVDPELQYITVYRHKTVKTTRRPQVVPISEQLRVILRDARQRTKTHVVEYRGKPVKSLRGGLAEAAKRAGVPFGRAVDGATFHTMRHTAATMLAAMGESEAIRKDVLGHRTIASTQKYTHLRPVHEISAHERLADAVPLADLVTARRKRASGRPVPGPDEQPACAEGTAAEAEHAESSMVPKMVRQRPDQPLESN